MRNLVVVADDLGIGPETTEGILDLACQGIVTGAVLLSNSPHAAHGAARWRERGKPCDLGWHPNLTLDHPICPPHEVSTLVGPDGRLGPLGRFLGRLALGLVRPSDIRRELLAQYTRFLELTGQEPTLVNAHHHVAVFPPVGAILRDILATQHRRPWLRRVRETRASWWKVGGARLKRLVLGSLGSYQARAQIRDGFPGGDSLAGIGGVRDETGFPTWVACAVGQTVELMCHPGRYDTTLLGRDATPGDGSLDGRVLEHRLLAQPAFRDAVGRAGFRFVRPVELLDGQEGLRHAA